MKSYLTEFWFSLAGALLIGGSAALLYLEERSFQSEGPPVGTITFKENHGQRKARNEVVWFEMDRSAPVYNFDTIRTAEKSEAILTLDNGTVLRLDELSMVFIEMGDEGVNLDLERGSLRVKSAAAPVRVQSGKRTIRMDAGDAAVQRRGDDVAVMVHAGNVRAGNGSAKSIQAGEEAELAEDGPRIRKSPALLQPLDGARVYLKKPDDPIAFAWEAGDEILWEVSSDRSFSNPRFSRRVNGRTSSASLPPGLYYWRVRGPGSEGIAVRSAKFRVIAAPKIGLIRPAPNAVLAGQETPVDFQWSPGPSGTSYSLRVGTAPDLNQAVYTTNTGVLRARTSLPPGRYYWRVDFSAPGTEEPFQSRVASFTLGKAGPGELRLIEPGYDSEITATDAIGFRWKGATGGDQYRLRIGRDADLARPISTRVVTGTELSVPLREPGVYYWRIDRPQRGGTTTASSETGRFRLVAPDLEVVPVHPRPGSEVIVSAPPELRFQWRCNRPDAEFTVQLSRRNGERIFSRNVRGTLFVLRDLRDLGPGRFVWSVAARGAGVEVKTNPVAFTLRAARPASPVNQTPEVIYVEQE